MRTIKFRGKRINRNGEWAYGDLRILPDRTLILPQESYDAAIDGDRVATQTVGQFTGLVDENGTEIYEGDIMGLPKCDAVGIEYKNRYVRVVEWINDGFFLVEHCEMGGELRKYGDRLALEISLKSRYAGIARCFKERGLDYTVIGNIHDNPELLKNND